MKSATPSPFTSAETTAPSPVSRSYRSSPAVPEKAAVPMFVKAWSPGRLASASIRLRSIASPSIAEKPRMRSAWLRSGPDSEAAS